MSLQHPFRRIIRPFTSDGYINSEDTEYILHPSYAKSAVRNIHSYLLLLKDVNELFEFVEPSYKNKRTFSYRIHELFIRTCVEVEANFTAILAENIYSNDPTKWTRNDYFLIDQTHKLSDYWLKLPRWEGTGSNFRPFRRWKQDPPKLFWYDYYNKVKHDIHSNFIHANLWNLMEAVSGLTAVISSQFYDQDFVPKGAYTIADLGDGFSTTIGGMFLISLNYEIAFLTT